MSAPSMRVAVVGAGRIGSMHGHIIAKQLPGATLVAVFDAQADAADRLARELHIDRAASIPELLTSADVDVVAVCSPTDTHASVIREAARAGKAVFCEKPVSMSLAEIDELEATLAGAGVPFMVGFNRRFDPGHAGVRRAVERGDVGDVHVVRITSRDPRPPSPEYVRASGGLFLDMAIHDFDMARFVSGSPVTRVYAQGAVRIDPAIGEAGDIDTAAAVLTHASGAITVIDMSRRSTYGYDQRVEAFGSRGMSQSGNHPVDHALVWNEAGSHGSPLKDFFLSRYADSYRLEWEAYLAYFHNGGSSPVSIGDGRASLVIAEAAHASRKLGTAIDVVQG